MKKININSNITINWKIWRGVNKVEEDFKGSNLRVFLIGTENTYYLVPKAEGGVLTMTIAQGMLAAGSYDLKAIWEKNGGRTLMSSTRSSIFGITEAEEADQKDEVMQIVSYVESYGRDGLSAFEIAVLRGLNRGCSSEAEWINSLYAGGEGGGAAILGTEIPIGGTALGDDLLNRADELEGHLKDNKLDSETPLNLLFKALLYKAKEIQYPTPVPNRGLVEHNKGSLLITTSYNEENRPDSKVYITVTYTPVEPTPTEPTINGMTWGYVDDEGTEYPDIQEAFGTKPSCEDRVGYGVSSVIVTNEGKSVPVIEEADGTYSFSPVVGDNNIEVTYDEGEFRYTIERLHVYPLNSVHKTYNDGVEIPSEAGTFDCGDLVDKTGKYYHREPNPTNYEATQGTATYNEGTIIITGKKEANVGQQASFKVEYSYGSCDTTDSTIKNTAGLPDYGYKTSKDTSEIKYDDITKVVTANETSGSIAVTLNGKTEGLSKNGDEYSFTVVDGKNEIIATLNDKSWAVSSEDATIYPLNEDKEVKGTLSVEAVTGTRGGGKPEATWSFDKVLPAILIMAAYDDPSDVILNTELQYAESGFDITDNENKEQYANLTTTEGATDYPWTVLIPKSRENATIAVWKWNRTKWTKAAAEFELKDENYIHTDGVTYRKYFSEDNTLTKADMCVKVII
jgi:hypothetical protein